VRNANAALYFCANLAPRLATFALMLVLTRLLPMGEYGLFVLVVTTGEILDMAVGNWVRIFVLRSESRDRRASSRRLGRTLVLTVGCCFLSCAGAFVLAWFEPGLSGRFTVAVVAYVVAFATLRLGLTLLQTMQRHRAYAMTEIARAALSLIFGVGATFAIQADFVVTSLGVSLATLIPGVLACALAFRSLPRPVLSSYGYNAAFSFGVPIITIALVGQISGWLDRFIINHSLGPAVVGLYAAAFALARQPVQLFSGALNPYVFPNLVRAYMSGGRRAAAPVQVGNLLALIILCGAVTAGIILLRQPFVDLVLPEDYRAEAVRVIPWIALATLCTSLRTFCFDNIFHITQRNWRQFAYLAPCAAISAIAGFLLIPQGGPVVAAMIAAGASGLALIGSAWLSYRLLPLVVPYRAIEGLILSIALASAAAWSAMSLLQGYPSVLILIGAATSFCAVYAVILRLCGFDLLRLLDRPWEIWRATQDAPAGLKASV
jgi:O-antigen/teichoic acid export membrane protein